jgi:hypothetical protein
MVRDFLPTSFPGHVVFTTRAHAMGRLAERIEVKKLGEEEGCCFLLRRSARLGKDAPLEMLDAATGEAARQIVRELDGLPLALDQAGAYIEEVNCSLHDYLSLYQTQRTELLLLRGGLVPDHPEPVTTTWRLAFERIEASNAGAADLLRLCAFLAPDEIPEAIIGTDGPELTPPLQQLTESSFQLNAALAALQASSLITRHADTQTLDVHRLVQAVLRDALSKEDERAWAERAVQVMAHLFPCPCLSVRWLFAGKCLVLSIPTRKRLYVTLRRRYKRCSRNRAEVEQREVHSGASALPGRSFSGSVDTDDVPRHFLST